MLGAHSRQFREGIFTESTANVFPVPSPSELETIGRILNPYYADTQISKCYTSTPKKCFFYFLLNFISQKFYNKKHKTETENSIQLTRIYPSAHKQSQIVNSNSNVRNIFSLSFSSIECDRWITFNEDKVETTKVCLVLACST